MQSLNKTRYMPVDNGYGITSSREYFNRTLYGSHANDNIAERFFTLAGDIPLFMGSSTDWSKHTACHYAKSGVFKSPSGIKFSVSQNSSNIACASIWDNFPTTLQIPLEGKASELALFFIGVTNPMQSQVENVRFTVSYSDGSQEMVSLTHPENFDDWLVPALQKENETVYFSDYNHGIVQRISLDSEKELSGLSIEAIANEVILGVIGMSILEKY